MGNTHSKPLAARHGRGTAWARHAMCESALKPPRYRYLQFVLSSVCPALTERQFEKSNCKISGFRREVGEKCALLGYYFFFTSWPLKMGPKGCPETSVRNYHYSLRNNPEERSSRKVLLFHSHCRVPGYGTLYSGTQFPILKYSIAHISMY